MVHGSIVSVFDRLSIKIVLTNSTGSYLGFLATLAFIIVCLVLLIPPVNQYFTGVYFQSQFVSQQYPKNMYYTGDDVILAVSFRNKITGQYANHTDILLNLQTSAYYDSYSSAYKITLAPCTPDVFLNAINPLQVKDCVMVPNDLQFDIEAIKGYIPAIVTFFGMKCEDVFKCNDNSPYKAEVAAFIKNLMKDYYFQYIFNSKVVDEKGIQKNQFHKVYSTQYQSPDGFATVFSVSMDQKKYFIDDSILPWWNNRTYNGIFWQGTASGIDVPEGYILTNGFYALYDVGTSYHYSYRYYKKLDFLLGMIGGAVFLIFLFFWVPFSYLNRTLQKIKTAQELFLTKDELITTEQNLHKVSIPFWYVVTKFLPGNQYNKIINQSQNQIDIVKLIKKLKVTHRNLRTKGIDLSFRTKDVDLDSVQPQDYVPDRPALQNLQITLDAYQALCKGNNTSQVYENDPVVLALLPDNNKKIDQVMQDQVYQKNRAHHKRFPTWRSCIRHYIAQFIRFFDIFGARPMLNAQPQTSSCWGFILTLIIIALSVLTFALTIKNMDNVKLIVSQKYEQPLKHNYEMITGKDFRVAFCFDSTAANVELTGTKKSVQFTFFKNSKKYGYQELQYQKMVQGEFSEYFQLDYDDPYNTIPAQNCFRPVDNQNILMGGSYQSINQAYVGARLDPYCSGLPSECAARKNQTIKKFVDFINIRTYGIYMNQNKYSPDKGTIISGIAGQAVSESDTLLNASLLRTQTIYVSSIELLDDTSKAFSRKDPKIIQKTMAYTNYGDRNEQRKGKTDVDPGYILELRPNGKVQSIILRSYKIDFLFGIIGGCFLFWYFFVHFFAQIYNSYKVRAKLAQDLHRQDGYDQSILVHFFHMIKIPPFVFCCSQLRKDLQRVSLVDEKMKRDLNYLNLIKNIDNCYKLSSAYFSSLVQKDLSLIYFRQKIDQSQLVKPKRIKQLQNDEFQDDQFLQFDDDQNFNELANNSVNVTGNILPEMSMAVNNLDLEKIINMGKSVETVPLYDPLVPNKKQNNFTKIIKKLDAFKTPPQFTFDGERDVKSVLGGIIFFGVTAVVIVIVVHFLTIYTDGTDFTISHRRLMDGDLLKINQGNTIGQLNPGINLVSGQNFKFLVTFNKKDHYYPYNVSQYIGPIGIRMLQYSIIKTNGVINQTYQQIELEQCSDHYLDGFLGPYNDPEGYKNISLGYCLPNGKSLSLVGIPEDSVNKYFKLNIYNKYGNSTGKSFLNSFFKIYLVQYYISVPQMDIFAKNFKYQMTKFDFFTDPYSYPLQTNLTFTKVVFTDKYYSRSRQTYNDKSSKLLQRYDINELSSESTRNVSFYYKGMIDHYTLDYPGGGELFGLVGGVIAMFFFIVYSLMTSYNQYRMKYLIGQRLYTFDKKLSGLSKQKGKKINMKKIEEATKKINNFDQLDLIIAWMLSPIGYIRDNYNFNKTLRRVTLLVDKVEDDINLFSVYKNLFTFKDAIDKTIKLHQNQQIHNPINLSSLYIKHIHQSETQQNHIPMISKQSKKHKFSSYEQFKLSKAIDAKINPQTVLGDRVLNRAFGIDQGSSVLGSRMKMLEERDESFNKRRDQHNRDNSRSIHDSNTHFRETGMPNQSSEHVDAFSIQEAEHQ